MIDNKDLEKTKKELSELESRLVREIMFCDAFVNKSKNQLIEKEWMSGVSSAYNYSQTLIRCFLKSIDDYIILSPDQFHFYVGKIAIQHLLEIINKFEQTINNAIATRNDFKELINKRIQKRVETFNANWNDNKNKRNKNTKKEILKSFELKIREQSFIRDTLYSNKIINKVDYSILCFAWDIRNSMHKNFVAVKNINFKYTDFTTGVNYTFNYPEGTELYHPGDLLGFLSISFQIHFIMLKILSNFEE